MGLGDWVDSIVGILSPESQLSRAAAREQIRQMKAGRVDRLRPVVPQRIAPDPKNIADIQRARWNAYQLYLDNSTVRRLVGAYVSQVVGSGPVPKSLARTRNGDPLPDVRRQMVAVWDQIKDRLRYARSPGAGAAGLHADMQAACREIVLAGEFLIYHRDLSEDDQRVGGHPVPYAYEIITANRLVMDTDLSVRLRVSGSNQLFRGIEFDPQGRRVAYHVYQYDPSDPRALSTEPIRVSARDVTHVYKEERPGQERGYSMLSPAIPMLSHLGEFLEQELISARVQNCVSLIIHSKSAKVGQSLLQTPSGNSGTDDDGNEKRELSQGMIVSLGSKDVEGITPFLPNRAAGNPDPLVGIFMRSVAAAVPGIKASSITGDYRASSYSSEKAADNDLWREVEQEQDWFYRLAYQAIWDRAMRAAIVEGLVTGVNSPVDGRQTRYLDGLMLDVEWHGPYPKSIDPNKDAEASATLIANHLSTYEAEAAAIGMDAEQNLQANAAFVERIIEAGLTPPETLVAPEPPEPNDTEGGNATEDD